MNHRSSVLATLTLFATALAGSAGAQTLTPLARPTDAPVITPDKLATFTDPITHNPVHWEYLHTFNPAAIVRDGKIVLLYRAEDNSGEMKIGGHTSRLGLATSTDGITFTRLPDPVFYPAEDDQKAREWPGGVEDPRLVQAEDGTYVLTYTQYNHVTYDIGIATSPDLIHWTKHGPAFLGAANGEYDHLRYKSGGIVTRLSPDAEHPDRIVAARINGTYWMYWGEGAIHLATSPDLIHWTPVKDPATHQPIEVLTKRPVHFDSGFPEVGPPPLLTAAGIMVIYNGKNDPAHGDPRLGPNAYAAGMAIFDSANPAHLLSRTEAPILKPEQPFEKTGQYAAGTTFAEGLVHFHSRWFLYYGCADSAVGVAATAAQP